MKSKLRSLIWLAVALLAMGFFAWQILTDGTTRTAFKDAISQINWLWALLALAVYMVSQTILAKRWTILLKVFEVPISFWQAVQLTYLGLFYNNVMPGAVGGDLLKAWYITHHSRKDLRLEAAVTVFVDRLIGLLGLIMIAIVASFFMGNASTDSGSVADSAGTQAMTADPVATIRKIVWAIFAVMVVAGTVFLSQRLRKVLRINHLLTVLPLSDKIAKIDQAIRIYRRYPAIVVQSLALAIGIQGLAIAAIWLLAYALGFEQVTFVQCLIIMPIAWVIGAAIPVPGGLGIIENCVTYLFCLVIDPGNPDSVIGQAAALAVVIRLMVCATSVPGALVPIFGQHLPKTDEMAREIAKEQQP
ncbi:MAG: flippase-like domain-containing protein [Sedimentisphaerales bacterium]|nr:flippase-like domain-containing protein [Sedimentisphaerales bacterium]